MLNFHLKNHAKINTILWHSSYDVYKDNKAKRVKRVQMIWVKNKEGKVVPATIWKEPECKKALSRLPNQSQEHQI